MTTRKVSFVPGEYYHIYNRGHSRQAIFLTEADHARFVALLFVSNGTKAFEFRELKNELLFNLERGEQLVAIGAYCLMPNHFHILLTPLVEGGVVSFMRKLATGYSMYFNQRHLRTGSLYGGKFKSEHVMSDNHLKYLFSYIHLNPVKLMQSDWQRVGINNKSEALQYLKKYKYSSYIDSGLTRPESAILNKEKFPDYFLTKRGYDNEMEDWLSFKDDID